MTASQEAAGVGSARWLLALDTATSQAVVALGRPDGAAVVSTSWTAGHRHGEELLPRIRELLGASGASLATLAGVVVGTGPGAFTGLRVGLATAKGLATALGCPIVGVSTGAALLAAATSAATAGEPSFALLLPAGPSDRILVHAGEARLLRGGDDAAVPGEDELIAVDLDGRAPPRAIARGKAALEALPATLVRMGAERLARGEADDLARLVPDYVTLPRGIRAGGGTGEVAWSRGRP